MIDVSCAIIILDKKLLTVQRGLNSDHPNKWEFPGGKIRKHETAEKSIKREIKEELSVEIEILRKLDSIEYDYGIKQIRLIPFVCKIKNGTLFLTEHVAMKWISVKECDFIDWSEADKELIIKNKAFFSSTAS